MCVVLFATIKLFYADPTKESRQAINLQSLNSICFSISYLDFPSPLTVTLFFTLGKYQNGFSHFLLGLSAIGSPILSPVCNWLGMIVTDKTLDCGLLKGSLFVDYKGVTQFISFIMRPYFF